ncbi:hypothetical protein BGP75_21115 [Motiliproteus sp. MSK22-1]|nr:hypothetical protein BGP75_21115 [Motiliproteus sp. MSK22-1]
MLGFSMVELMVALALGLLLTAAVLQTFVSLKQTYEFQEEFSRIQENGRFGIEFLTRDIRGADFWGCNSDGIGTSIRDHLNPSSDAAYSFGVGVDGTDGSSGVNTASDSPDTLVLRGASGFGANVVVVPATTAAALQISNNSGLVEDEIVLLSDCSHGEIFQVTNNPSAGGTANFDLVTHNTGNTSVGPGNATQTLQKIYATDAQIYRASSVTYSIADGASGEPALFRNGDELVEGVENFQVMYGEDTDSDGAPNYYVPAGAAGLNMDQVVSIHISLLIRSLRDNLTEAAQSIQYNGATLSPGDRRVRKVFSSRVAVRNRLD